MKFKLSIPILIVLATSFAFSPAPWRQAAADHPDVKPVHILALHSYSQQYPWTARQHEGFVNALRQSAHRPLDIKTEYLDTKRRKLDRQYVDQLANFLRAKYAGYSPAAIYVTDDNGLNFALQQADVLFPDVPIFFSGVNDYSHLDTIDRSKVTGVFERKEIQPNLILLRQLLGDFGRILVVGDGSATYQAIETELKKEMVGGDRLKITFIAESQIDKIVAHLAGLPKQPIILTTLGAVRNAAGEVLPLKEIMSRITKTDHELVVSMEDVYLFDGVLGGFVTSGIAQGEAAAELMNAYLTGTRLADLTPITKSPNEYLFNDQTIEALNLEIPAEIAKISRLINPRLSWTTKYREQILGAIIILSLALASSLLAYLWVLVTKNRQLTTQGERLRESEQSRKRESRLLEDVERLSKIGGWQVDLLTGQLVWSAETYRIHEIPEDVQPNVEDAINFYAPEDQPIITAAVEAGLQDGTPWDLELSIISAKGNRKSVRAIGEAVFVDGKPVTLRGTFQDITERKKFERELDEARQQAESASDAKSKFLATMSHELRTPLNAIIGFADIISHRYLGSMEVVKYEEYANDIRSSGEHLLSLINNILDISTIEAGGYSFNKEWLDAKEIIEESVGMVSETAHSTGIDLMISESVDGVCLHVDRRAIRQILLNLLSNAVKFTPRGGKIEVSATADSRVVTLNIVDTGIGISALKLREITEPFARGERDPHKTVDGWGLGLSITKSLVENHGGSLVINSKENEGTTISVVFPIEEAAGESHGGLDNC